MEGREGREGRGLTSAFAILDAGNEAVLYRQCNNSAEIVDSKLSNAISILLGLALY